MTPELQLEVLEGVDVEHRRGQYRVHKWIHRPVGWVTQACTIPSAKPFSTQLQDLLREEPRVEHPACTDCFSDPVMCAGCGFEEFLHVDEACPDASQPRPRGKDCASCGIDTPLLVDGHCPPCDRRRKEAQGFIAFVDEKRYTDAASHQDDDQVVKVADVLPACGLDGCKFQPKNAHSLRVHRARGHNPAPAGARQRSFQCPVDDCDFAAVSTQGLATHKGIKHRDVVPVHVDQVDEDQVVEDQADDEGAAALVRQIRADMQVLVAARPVGVLLPAGIEAALEGLPAVYGDSPREKAIHVLRDWLTHHAVT